jgi:hypothetical protein
VQQFVSDISSDDDGGSLIDEADGSDGVLTLDEEILEGEEGEEELLEGEEGELELELGELEELELELELELEELGDDDDAGRTAG